MPQQNSYSGSKQNSHQNPFNNSSQYSYQNNRQYNNNNRQNSYVQRQDSSNQRNNGSQRNFNENRGSYGRRSPGQPDSYRKLACIKCKSTEHLIRNCPRVDWQSIKDEKCVFCQNIGHTEDLCIESYWRKENSLKDQSSKGSQGSGHKATQ